MSRAPGGEVDQHRISLEVPDGVRSGTSQDDVARRRITRGAASDSVALEEIPSGAPDEPIGAGAAGERGTPLGAGKQDIVTGAPVDPRPGQGVVSVVAADTQSRRHDAVVDGRYVVAIVEARQSLKAVADSGGPYDWTYRRPRVILPARSGV